MTFDPDADNSDTRTIRRVKLLRDYVEIPNSTAQDERLSYEARGLLLYLLSLPEDWEIRVSQLQKQGGVGRDGVRRILRELQSFGYVSGYGEQARAGRGRFGKSEVVVYVTPAINPEFSPATENQSTVDSPVTARPATENPATVNQSPYKEHNPQSTQETKTHTQRHLRAAGAPEDRVCVDSFSKKAYERYAANHLGEIRNPVGWASKAKETGKWDDLVAQWCTKHGIDPLTGENIATTCDKAENSEVSQSKCTSECPQCFGTGWESVPGKGARRCPNSTAQSQAA